MSSKVSIIIPTFNRAHLIHETLDSVLDQLYLNWECIVVDDGSLDNSISIINFYLKKDNRFKLLIRPNHRIKGASTCRNIGVENSTGKFIQFLDSDDLLSRNKISEQIKLLENCSENVISTCKWGRFDINLKDSNILENLATYDSFDNPLLFLDALSVSKGYFPPNAYLIKADLVKKVGLWNEYLTINDDGEFMMRVIANTEKIYFASEAIAYYRHTTTTNLSNYTNKENVNDVIYSWKLVDSYLKIRFKKDVISYVEIMKSVLYSNVKNSFPELIFKHEYFFKKQLEDYELWRRIKAKIKQRLTKL